MENAYKVYYGYSQGGLVDYTGPAIVHGTPSKPEAFLNASQTAQITFVSNHRDDTIVYLSSKGIATSILVKEL